MKERYRRKFCKLIIIIHKYLCLNFYKTCGSVMYPEIERHRPEIEQHKKLKPNQYSSVQFRS